MTRCAFPILFLLPYFLRQCYISVLFQSLSWNLFWTTAAFKDNALLGIFHLYSKHFNLCAVGESGFFGILNYAIVRRKVRLSLTSLHSIHSRCSYLYILSFIFQFACIASIGYLSDSLSAMIWTLNQPAAMTATTVGTVLSSGSETAANRGAAGSFPQFQEALIRQKQNPKVGVSSTSTLISSTVTEKSLAESQDIDATVFSYQVSSITTEFSGFFLFCLAAFLRALTSSVSSSSSQVVPLLSLLESIICLGVNSFVSAYMFFVLGHWGSVPSQFAERDSVSAYLHCCLLLFLLALFENIAANRFFLAGLLPFLSSSLSCSFLISFSNQLYLLKPFSFLSLSS